jgi:hypothetical protein
LTIKVQEQGRIIKKRKKEDWRIVTDPVNFQVKETVLEGVLA